jgi:hypothetical protein
MDLNLLQDIIKAQDLNVTQIVRLTHMSHNTLNNKFKGIREFKVSELIKLKRALCLSHDTMSLLIFGPEKLKGGTMQGRKPYREEWKYFEDAGLDSREWLVQKATNEILQIVNKESGVQKLIAKTV